MTMQLKQATRTSRKPRIAVYGMAGGGKTIAALQIATAIKQVMGRPGPIVVLDTEQESSALYAVKHAGDPTSPNGPDFKFDYQILDFTPPYSPARFAQAMDLLVEADPAAIIIDSAAAFWSGEGGLLDIQADMVKRGTNSFQAWGQIKPQWVRMVAKLINASAPIVACFRAKQLWSTGGEGGGTLGRPLRVGEGPAAPNEILYEFDFAFSMHGGESALVDKSRSGLFPPGTQIKSPKVDDYVEIIKWIVGEGDLAVEDVYAYANGETVPESARGVFAQYMTDKRYGLKSGRPTRDQLKSFFEATEQEALDLTKED